MDQPSFRERLRTRKIAQWALAYAAGAWVFLEFMDHVSEQFGWSDMVGRVLLVLAACGLLLVLVIAWYHGEKGRQWVSGPELLIIALLLLISGGVLRMLGTGSDDGQVEEDAGAAGIPATLRGDAVDDRPSIAVLPFDDFSPDPSNAYFADGIQDEITSRLSLIQGLGVKGRTSVERYREDRPPVSTIARELGVDFLLEGSARVAGDQVRIVAQLIDTRADDHVWSEAYERRFSIENLFDVQAEIARRVANEVGAVLTPEEEARLASRPTENLDAWELYLRGIHQWNRFTEEGVRQARDYLNEAISMDSAFAAAYAGLADTYTVMGVGFGLGSAVPGEVMPQARAAAERAIDLDPLSASAYSSLATVALAYEYEYAEAQRLLDTALELQPSLELAHARQAHLYSVLGRHEEAVAANRRAATLDPLRPITATDYGYILLAAGRLEEAEQAAQQARRLDPEFAELLPLEAYIQLHQGRYGEAAETYRRVTGSYAENPRIRGGLAFALARSGDEAAAREILNDLLALSEIRYVSPKHIGLIYLGLGEDKKALDWFERGVEVRGDWMCWIRLLPGIDHLWPNPRFQEILRWMNLSPEGGALRG